MRLSESPHFDGPYAIYFWAMNTSRRRSRRERETLAYDSVSQVPSRQQYLESPQNATISSQYFTELECQPFFLDFPSLSESDYRHFQNVGLLSRAIVPQPINEEEQDEEKYDVCIALSAHVKYVSQVWLRTCRRNINYFESSGDDDPLFCPTIEDTEANDNAVFEPVNLLSRGLASLDANQPWMIYWCLHGADLLGHAVSDQEHDDIVAHLQSCWADASAGGGFGGGYYCGLPHVANSYAAVLSLGILAATAANSDSNPARAYLHEIRAPLRTWLLSLLSDCGGVYHGSFRMHHDGEMDIRATYCVLTMVKLLNLWLDPNDTTNDVSPFLQPAVVQYIENCQTWEGGFGGEPGAEAHGGYCFCATAAYWIHSTMAPTSASRLDWASAVAWISRRQMSFEGGFQGRTNKLVDGCYSFWQGSAMVLATDLVQRQKHEGPNRHHQDPWLSLGQVVNPEDSTTSDLVGDDTLDHHLFDRGMLQRYILLCAQDVPNGGFRDKPSARRDFYHSCYNLSGLSVSQLPAASGDSDAASIGYGHEAFSRVEMTHPCYNIRVDHVRYMLQQFESPGPG
jgi:protein farnesyltransferase subunit beta